VVIVKRFHDVCAKCPYYDGEEKQKIICEGVQDGASIHMAFDTPQNRRNYKKKFCNKSYNECLIAEALNRKWGYDEK
jgi:hypothetical protein